jgi:hypothetical protein
LRIARRLVAVQGKNCRICPQGRTGSIRHSEGAKPAEQLPNATRRMT